VLNTTKKNRTLIIYTRRTRFFMADNFIYSRRMRNFDR